MKTYDLPELLVLITAGDEMGGNSLPTKLAQLKEQYPLLGIVGAGIHKSVSSDAGYHNSTACKLLDCNDIAVCNRLGFKTGHFCGISKRELLNKP